MILSVITGKPFKPSVTDHTTLRLATFAPPSGWEEVNPFWYRLNSPVYWTLYVEEFHRSALRRDGLRVPSSLAGR